MSDTPTTAAGRQIDDGGVEPGAPSGSRRRLAWWAGVASATVALGAGEVAAALGGQSLVASVGAGFIETVGKYVAKPAIELLGTADKPALVAGIVVISLVVGGWAGRRSLTSPWVGPATFGAFGLLGAIAGVADPAAAGGVAVVAALAAAIAGIAALWLLLAVLRGALPTLSPPDPGTLPAAPDATPPPGADDDAPDDSPDRRRFLAWTGGVGAFGLLLGAGSLRLRSDGAAQVARRGVTLPPVGDPVAVPQGLEVPGLSPYVTPNDAFYRIDTALVPPQVDPATWKLRFAGMVDRPFEITYDELVERATVETAITIACVSNEVGGSLVGNALWQGVPLRDLLDEAGVSDGADQLVGRSVDGFTVGFPTEAAFDGRDALVAVGMNGEPLPVDHGFPARLVVAGLYGYVSATKWLSEIELTTWDAFDAYWIPRGWAERAPVKTQSRIDVPRPGSEVEPGPRTIAGVAWAPTRGIDRVEVQVDDGPWQDAELGEVVGDTTWRQWALPWDAPSGDHRLRVRATDGDGETQTSDEARPAPDGATGWHTVEVSVS